MSESSHIAETYAGLLTGSDIMQMFSYLEKSLGSRSKAAKMCRITRKTVYDWDTTGDLRLQTKIKVLSVLLDTIAEEAFDYIVKRAGENAEDVVRTYLQILYESAMTSTDRRDVLRAVAKFDEIRTKYAKYILGGLEAEVGQLLARLVDRAKGLGLDWLPKPVEVFDIVQLKSIIPFVIQEIAEGGTTVNELEVASKLNIPSELVKVTVESVYAISHRLSALSERRVEPLPSEALESWRSPVSQPQLEARRQILAAEPYQRIYALRPSEAERSSLLQSIASIDTAATLPASSF